MDLSDVPPFEQWPCQQVKVEHGTLFLRYAGAGPSILLLHGVPQHSVSLKAHPEDLTEIADIRSLCTIR